MPIMTDYFRNKLVDQIFRARAYSFPSTLYVALYTVSPGRSTPGTEVTGGSYARVAIALSDSAFLATNGAATGASSGSTGTTSNGATVTFPSPTANWGIVVAVGIVDASSGGNILMFTPCNDTTVNNGDPAPSFAAGGLIFTLDKD